MAVQVIAANGAEEAAADFAGGLRYFARQPILDCLGRVHGYELLFRGGPTVAFSGDGDLATRTMLDNSVIFGLELLTSGYPAFVNCTREALLEETVQVLPPAMTVLEVLEDLEPDAALIAACRRLKTAGFRLALDDFVWKPGMERLLQLADYVKVDFIQTGERERGELMRRLDDYAVTLLAEKVETYEQYEQAGAEGFALVQGYFFCRPVLLRGRKIPPNRLSQMQILKELKKNPLDLSSLSEILKRDASVTYRLLRLINSPVCGMQQEVSSILSALLAVGDEVFRRVAMLAIASELNAGRPPELLRMALVRGRFCELAAARCSLDPAEQFLLGLLSLVSAMTGTPMERLTPLLPLRPAIREALEGAETRERSLLEWVVRHERGDWTGCHEVASACNLDGEAAAQSYAQALLWAEQALQFGS
jgi:c-di-GMP-related signal transduction protein